jgi:hypothetical protein
MGNTAKVGGTDLILSLAGETCKSTPADVALQQAAAVE